MPNREPEEEIGAFKPPVTVRYSDEDLDMFAEVVNQAKVEAMEEMRMLKERLDDLTSFDMADESMVYSMHMAEQGSEAQEKEKTYAQIQRIHEYIKKLDEALDRIRNKTYGICRVCNCLIAKERLLAVPVTTLSASYKIHQRCPEDGIDKIEPVRNLA
jgi:RNA polymerase-binding transcription factor DksA